MLPSQAGNGAAALARSTIMGMARTSSGRVGAGLPRGANGSGAAAGVRGPGNGTGPPSGQGAIGGRFERDRDVSAAAAAASGSEGDSDSAEDEELVGERRGIKRTLGDMELGVGGTEAVAAAAAAGAYGGVSGAVSGAKPGKKTRGRVKIKMEFIDNKLRRYTTFSKRKTGIMKKVPPLGRGGRAAFQDGRARLAGDGGRNQCWGSERRGSGHFECKKKGAGAQSCCSAASPKRDVRALFNPLRRTVLNSTCCPDICSSGSSSKLRLACPVQPSRRLSRRIRLVLIPEGKTDTGLPISHARAGKARPIPVRIQLEADPCGERPLNTAKKATRVKCCATLALGERVVSLPS